MQAYTPDTQVQAESQVIPAGSPVRIAYFIMVHHQPDKFKSLFQKIYTRDQVYLIHIDRKAKDGFTEEIQQFIIQFPNAYILESMNINSGGFSIIQTQINAMEFLLNVNEGWDFFINLSGEDQPLKSQSIIRKFLGQNRNKNYLFYYDQKFYRPDTLQRIHNHFTELAYRISSLIYKREFMKDVVPYIGGKWVIFTRETCRFFSMNDKVMVFEDFYLHTFFAGRFLFSDCSHEYRFQGNYRE
ncbi:beta-1,6-N-acetylglucosaminyltransferase [Chryseobacterium sp. POE27]|uniref:beta-1,6-N-acetylglucosaminyltransferase n=1 Tax=Chryseobacterium sp. POE27 TaxID=3138177 RepID=UPI003219EDD3